jgi:hypothetical protein
MKQVPLKEAVGSRVNIMSCDGHLSSSNTGILWIDNMDRTPVVVTTVRNLNFLTR